MKKRITTIFTWVSNHKAELLIIIICLFGIQMLFIPLETLKKFGEGISPLGSVQDKTILLFKFIKISFPIFGICGLIWLKIPASFHRPLQHTVNNLLSSSWVLPLILILSCIIRIAWIVYYPTNPYADSIWYFRNASELAAGQGFVYSIESHKPLAAWPVGYPVFLALFYLITGPSIFIAKILNVLLSVLCVFMTYIVAKHIFNHKVGVLSALLLAFFPGMIVYSSLVASDLLFMTMTTACFIIFLKSQIKTRPGKKYPGEYIYAFWLGIVNGLTSLIRSTGLILFPFWIIMEWLLGYKARGLMLLKWTAAIAVGIMVILSPWIVRNYIHFNAFIPVSTNGGANFWIGNNPNAFGGYMWPKDVKQNPLIDLVGSETVIDKIGYSLGLQFIKANPLRALQLIPAKIFYLLNSNDFGLHWNKLSALSDHQNGTGNRAYAYTNLVYLVMVVLAIIGIGTLIIYSKFELLTWSGIFFSVYWIIIHLPFFGQDRFMMPAWPFLSIYAAVGISYIYNIDTHDGNFALEENNIINNSLESAQET